MIKKCVICGKEFETNKQNKKTCCRMCSFELNRTRARESYREKRNILPKSDSRRKKKKEPKVDNLTRLSVEAAEHGMSYGKYVAMLERKKND